DPSVRYRETDSSDLSNECVVVLETPAIGQIDLSCTHVPALIRAGEPCIRFQVDATAGCNALVDIEQQSFVNERHCAVDTHFLDVELRLCVFVRDVHVAAVCAQITAHCQVGTQRTRPHRHVLHFDAPCRKHRLRPYVAELIAHASATRADV